MFLAGLPITTTSSASKSIIELKPDVAVLDISMPEINGILIARKIAEECPSVRILVHRRSLMNAELVERSAEARCARVLFDSLAS